LILLLVPVVCALAGLAIYGVLKLTGVFEFPGVESRPAVREPGWRPWRSEATGFRARVDEIPRGCLLGVIIAVGVWIVGWLVVLVLGLHLLG
jgi:hypothetical protein